MKYIYIRLGPRHIGKSVTLHVMVGLLLLNNIHQIRYGPSLNIILGYFCFIGILFWPRAYALESSKAYILKAHIPFLRIIQRQSASVRIRACSFGNHLIFEIPNFRSLSFDSSATSSMKPYLVTWRL